MQVSNITFTGADDTTSVAHLEEVSMYFPFVEWGILFPSTGGNRFPSRKWVAGLEGSDINLSAHLCGSFVPTVLSGNISTFAGITGVKLFNQFKRIQLNFHGLPITVDIKAFNVLVERLGKEVIVQMDGTNNWVADASTNTSLLFDTSSGAGRTPFAWPSVIEGRKCGYAGGLGPNNLRAELDYLDYFLPTDAVIWVDMETKIRTIGFTDSTHESTNNYFDIDRVIQCAEIVAPYIAQETYVSAA